MAEEKMNLYEKLAKIRKMTEKKSATSGKLSFSFGCCFFFFPFLGMAFSFFSKCFSIARIKKKRPTKAMRIRNVSMILDSISVSTISAYIGIFPFLCILLPNYTKKNRVCQERGENLFDRCRKKMQSSDKNAHTCARFGRFSVIFSLFVSHGFS